MALLSPDLILAKWPLAEDFIHNLSFLQLACLVNTAGVVLLSIYCWFSAAKYTGIPRVRDGMKSRFSLKTRLEYYTNCEGLYKEAYETYLKKGQPCLVPGLGLRSEILLPKSTLRWLVTQSDNILSMREAFRELDQIDWAADHHKYVTDAWLTPILNRDVNRNLDRYLPPLGKEVQNAVERRIPNKGEWAEIPLWDTMKLVIAQISSQFTVGEPLCRDEEYIRASSSFVDTFVTNAGLVPFVPVPLRPILCPILYLPLRFKTWKLERILKPLIKQRLERLLTHQQPSKGKNEHLHDITSCKDTPDDLLQLMLCFAQNERSREEFHNLHSLAYRICLNNLGSFHQSSAAVTNMIFNIIASDKEFNTIALLREEIGSVLPSECYTIPPSTTQPVQNNKKKYGWTKASVAKLVLMDSVMRETTRVHSFVHRAVARSVVADNVHSPVIEGEADSNEPTTTSAPLPKGAMVSILSRGAYFDPDVFDDPMKFNPWRFAERRERHAKVVGGRGSDQHASDRIIAANDTRTTTAAAAGAIETFTVTSANNLVFGHGRHACPGRFIAEAEIKMLLVTLLMNYDVGLLPVPGADGKGEVAVRPESPWILEVVVPPIKGKIMAKRRGG
ncbi:cytochrome P450 [Blastomyces dermatitidis ER-3]|uniref:Cytochrome P450 n=2 Tax=Ajellomyces dermatitidis (strain ER-3 / ATCC MYA-2586) TaxID=559297 RepID=A0ABP2EPG5_AJEDR|nr:cytochrome P450 [Blastomyces dermatitidis ER-3]EEQ85057.1 cytochrome P450 [Blastomyces dermatitidis ER-3]